MSVLPKEHSNTYYDVSNMYYDGINICNMVKKYYPMFEICNENVEAIFAYSRNANKVDKEIAIMLLKDELIYVAVKSNIQEKEITDGGFRVLNQMNCKGLLTHQIDIMKKVYQCRCTITRSSFLNNFASVMDYIEAEHAKGKELLFLERR